MDSRKCPAPETLPEENVPFVIENIEYAQKLARQFHHKRKKIGVDYCDIEGAALLGLCDAARRFDRAKNTDFRTYCYFRIRGAMYDLLRQGGGISRRHFNRMRIQRQQLDKLQERESEVTEEELESLEHEVPYTFASTAEELASLVNTIDRVGLQLWITPGREAVYLTYANQETPEGIVALERTRAYLRALVEELPEPEYSVVVLRYFKEWTFDQIGKELGSPSRSWVSRMHGNALEALRGALERDQRYSSERILSRAG